MIKLIYQGASMKQQKILPLLCFGLFLGQFSFAKCIQFKQDEVQVTRLNKLTPSGIIDEGKYYSTRVLLENFPQGFSIGNVKGGERVLFVKVLGYTDEGTSFLIQKRVPDPVFFQQYLTGSSKQQTCVIIAN
jgi:hypothetical protein